MAFTFLGWLVVATVERSRKGTEYEYGTESP